MSPSNSGDERSSNFSTAGLSRGDGKPAEEHPLDVELGDGRSSNLLTAGLPLGDGEPSGEDPLDAEPAVCPQKTPSTLRTWAALAAISTGSGSVLPAGSGSVLLPVDGSVLLLSVRGTDEHTSPPPLSPEDSAESPSTTGGSSSAACVRAHVGR